MQQRVGVDVGGTFTDVVTIENGRLHATKVPSTPEAPDVGVLDGLDAAAAVPGDVTYVGHGTTVATNAVLERDWADTALVTTEGFRDVLEIGRGDRAELYDLRAERPPPVVPRDRRVTVDERITGHGDVETPLTDAAIDRVVDTLADADVESVAICLLFAFANDAHERALADAIGERVPDVTVTRSSRLLPEIREYERTLATALNAALGPRMDTYLGRLVSALDDRGLDGPLRLMLSNGGVAEASHARRRPIETLLSGPAAGVRGAAFVAERSGYGEAITMDMGGTSCDVSIVRDGEPVVRTDVAVGGYPVGVPTVDVHTVGAGGGSIAWIDDGGALRVGPRSAGARPGPACYGRGGTRPTVTDAQAILGRIDPDAFLPADMDGDVEAARSVVEAHVAAPLDMTVPDAASGILRVANANMARALRVMTVERGHDPRDMPLVAFGGAGPLHAPSIADDLDVPLVLVPAQAGVLSALGLGLADLVHDFSTSLVRPWADLDLSTLADRFETFEAEGTTRLAEAGLDDGAIAIERRVDLRYRGQSSELSIDVPAAVTGEAMDAVVDRFHDEHERRYGHATPDEPLELVTVRVRVHGAVDTPKLATATASGDPIVGSRSVRIDGDWHDAAVYDRASLSPDAAFDGPAIVEGPATTILVPPGRTARVDDLGTIAIGGAT